MLKIKLKYFKLFYKIFIIIVLLNLSYCKTFNSGELAKKYHPEGKYIKIFDYKIFVIEKNLELSKEKTPILFIHGFSSNIHTWEALFNQFDNEFSYPIIAIDLLGFGFSDKPEISYTREFYLDLIYKIISYYNFKKVLLVGNSMGGEISLRFTIQHPELVEKLILIDSAGLIERKNLPWFLQKSSKFFLSSFNFIFTNKTAIRYFLKTAFYDPTKVNQKKVELYYLPLKTEGGTRAHLSLFDHPIHKIPFEDLKKIQIPTLIIWGLNDQWIPLEHGLLLNKHILNSKLVILPETGHVPQEEKPEEVFFYLKEFIKKTL